MRPPPTAARLLLAAIAVTAAACTRDQPTALLTPAGQPNLNVAIFQKPTKTATGYWERGASYDWDVSKSVTPATREIAPGASAVFSYTVTATRTEASSAGVFGVRGKICVKNSGTAASQGMTIVDNIYASTNGKTWTIIHSAPVDVSGHPSVAPGEESCYDYDVPFTPAPGAEYRNEGAITWTNAGNGLSGDQTSTQTWETPLVPFTLPTTAEAAEVDATAALADLLTCPAGFTCSPLGQSWTLTGDRVLSYDVQVTNTGAGCGASGKLDNRAKLTEGTSGETHTADASASVTTPACVPGLKITKTADADTVEAGGQIGFGISVSNTGAGVARSVTITDPLPTGTGLSWSISPSVAGCSIGGGVLSCSLGDLAAGAGVTVHLVSSTTASSCGTYSNTASAQAENHAKVQSSAKTTVHCTPPPPPTRVGTQGCTPGYWKQSQHFGNWVGYTPSGSSASRYNTVFGVNLFSSSTTLLTALGTGGGGKYRLGRHSTAALLSASNNAVDYGMTPAQVIALVRSVVLSGQYDSASDVFEKLNERGCPLGRNP